MTGAHRTKNSDFCLGIIISGYFSYWLVSNGLINTAIYPYNQYTDQHNLPYSKMVSLIFRSNRINIDRAHRRAFSSIVVPAYVSATKSEESSCPVTGMQLKHMPSLPLVGSLFNHLSPTNWSSTPKHCMRIQWRREKSKASFTPKVSWDLEMVPMAHFT